MANCVSDSNGMIHIITAKLNEHKCCFTLCRRRIEYNTSNNFSLKNKTTDSCSICEELYAKYYNFEKYLNSDIRSSNGNLINKITMSLNQAHIFNKLQFKLVNREYDNKLAKYRRQAK
jgi:hypothetical protein